MKKIVFVLTIFTILTTFIVPSTYALTDTERMQRKDTMQKRMDEKKNEFKESITPLQEAGVVRVTGQLTQLTGATLTLLAKDGKTYTIMTDTSKLLRRFGGKSQLDEFSVGDEVMVIGTYTDASQTTINARLIRNGSVQKRFGAFFGTVTSKTTTDFVIESERRGKQTVKFSTAAKIVDRTSKPITFNAIQIGDKVRVKGVWDNKLNIITVADAEREGIKDFSIPVATDSAEKMR